MTVQAIKRLKILVKIWHIIASRYIKSIMSSTWRFVSFYFLNLYYWKFGYSIHWSKEEWSHLQALTKFLPEPWIPLLTQNMWLILSELMSWVVLSHSQVIPSIRVLKLFIRIGPDKLWHKAGSSEYTKDSVYVFPLLSPQTQKSKLLIVLPSQRIKSSFCWVMLSTLRSIGWSYARWLYQFWDQVETVLLLPWQD